LSPGRRSGGRGLLGGHLFCHGTGKEEALSHRLRLEKGKNVAGGRGTHAVVTEKKGIIPGSRTGKQGQ